MKMLKKDFFCCNIIYACLIMTLFSCSPFTAVNQPLQKWSKEQDVQALKQFLGRRSGDLLVMVAFSGGGTRAAAFSYGVLKELAQIHVVTAEGKRTLLHEVDIISSVSGGSFTSAYYGLHGEKGFEDFENRFLRKNVQGALIGRELNPYYWIRRMSPAYSKADMVASYYDKYLFDHATFADFRKTNAPLIVINATDLAAGNRFPFTQAMFDLICSNFDSYPVSRAVAASSAVPVLFSPITLKNYAGQCGFRQPNWFNKAEKDSGTTTRKVQAHTLKTYMDKEKRPWFHRIDGGISDNLGLRSFYDMLSISGNPKATLGALLHPHPRQILVISVNAYAKAKTDWALKHHAPSLAELIGSVTSDQIARYSMDTIDIIRYAGKSLSSRISTPGRPTSFNFVEVSFEEVTDDSEREFLHTIGTNFHLSNKEVDHLISAARNVLRASPELKSFLERNKSNMESF